MATIPDRYTNTAIALHWLIALIIFAAFPLGVYMHDLPLSPTKLHLYSYHKWMGITVLLLAILRIVWRTRNVPPALPEHMPRWQKIASHATHHLLYVLIIIVPMTGWLMSSAKGFQTVWFGVLPLPDLLGKDKALGELLTSVHQALNFTMLALVAMHIAAVIKHRYIDGDQILARMLPRMDRS
jgi:cytochrome b561